MLFDGQLLIEKLIASFLVGYLLGSVPFAQVAARLNGMDIFRTGSHKAGTANVFWNVGRRTGAAVLLGDVVKGVLAVAIARLLGLDGLLLLLPAGAAILGHWNSIFTRFRGGDGMATLLGASLAAGAGVGRAGNRCGIRGGVGTATFALPFRVWYHDVFHGDFGAELVCQCQSGNGPGLSWAGGRCIVAQHCPAAERRQAGGARGTRP